MKTYPYPDVSAFDVSDSLNRTVSTDAGFDEVPDNTSKVKTAKDNKKHQETHRKYQSPDPR